MMVFGCVTLNFKMQVTYCCIVVSGKNKLMSIYDASVIGTT